MAKPIGTLGTVDTLTIGGRVFTDLVDLITLAAKVQASDGATFRKMGSQAGSGYQVTTGKTLSIYALIGEVTGAGSVAMAICQTDNDNGMSTGTTYTNPVYFGSESATVIDMFQFGGAATGQESVFAGYPLGKVLATKYLTGNNQSAAGVVIRAYGYEA